MSKLALQQEEIAEFMTEANENLDSGEEHLLKMDRGEPFASNYDAVFRAFHSIKGVAGMLGLDELQHHLHQLETQLQNCRDLPTLEKDQISYFLKGIDSTRELLDGQSITFDYTFPSKSQGTHPPTALSAAPVTPVPKSASPLPTTGIMGKAMVIDDDVDMMEFLADTLKETGIETHGFTDPVEAMSQLAKIKPDIVFSDMKMPKMSGLDVLKHVVAFDQEIPVMFSSGFLTKEALIHAISLGVFGILEKPYEESQLIAMALNALRKHKFVKLLNRSINFMMFQLTDLEKYLEQTGQTEAKAHLQTEIKAILDARRELKKIKG